MDSVFNSVVDMLPGGRSHARAQRLAFDEFGGDELIWIYRINLVDGDSTPKRPVLPERSDAQVRDRRDGQAEFSKQLCDRVWCRAPR
jgi:hypothetical protein